MVPGLEFFNHADNAHTVNSLADGTGIVLVASAAIKRGEEAFLNYGTHRGAAAWHATYNMQHSSSHEEDNGCATHLSYYASDALRFNVQKRVECFAAQVFTLSTWPLLRGTMAGALQRGDTAAVKGLARALSKALQGV